MVVVEGRALAAVRADAGLGHAAGLVGRGLHRGVLDTGRAAQTEQEGVRAAQDVDAVDVVGIPRNVGDEVVAGGVGRGQAAHALGAGRGAQLGLLAVAAVEARERALGAGHLGIGGVLEQRTGVGRADVVHQILGDDRHGRADILQLGTDAGAGEGVGGDIAPIRLGADFERTEDDDILLRGGGLVGRLLCVEPGDRRDTRCCGQQSAKVAGMLGDMHAFRHSLRLCCVGTRTESASGFRSPGTGELRIRERVRGRFRTWTRQARFPHAAPGARQRGKQAGRQV